MHSGTWLACAAVAFATACGSSGDDVPADKTQVTFQASNDDILNPERGLYLAGRIAEAWDFSKMRGNGMTLTYAHVDLPTSGAIPTDMMTAMQAGLDRVRAAGLKIIVRFAYNSASTGADAPLATVLQHIDQLKPLLEANSDVIIALEAGFIGAYGEWHDSTNGLDNPADRKTIVEAELAALPASRTVLLRAPMYKMENWGGPLADGFTADSAARIGEHNDCFLATDTDYGTYPSTMIDTYKGFVAQETQFVPMSGGPCKVNPPRSSCPSALAELAQLHYSMLSSRGNDMVWDMWKADGCAPEIARHVGYRLELVKALFDKQTAPGGVLALQVDLKNVGYASPFTERPVYVVLDGNGVQFKAKLTDVDMRRWLPGDRSVSVRLRVPGTLAPGNYRLALWLPDPDTRLQDRAEYSIQLANTNVWDAATGSNTLTSSLVIDAMAPGADVDPSATDLIELP